MTFAYFIGSSYSFRIGCGSRERIYFIESEISQIMGIRFHNIDISFY